MYTIIKQIPKLDILNQLNSLFLQIISFLLLSLVYYKFVSTKMLPTYKQYIITTCIIFNPFILHYVLTQPQISLLMGLLMLLHFEFQFNWLIASIFIVLAPQFFILIAGYKIKEIRNIFLIIVATLLLIYIITPQYVTTFFTGKHFPTIPLTQEPSMNFIWLIQSHMFNEYQDLYYIYLRVSALFMAYPLYHLKLPISLYNLIATLIGIFLLDYCPIGLHYILGISYFINYWQHRQRFIQEDIMLNQKIEQYKDKNVQFLIPFKFKLWLLIGTGIVLTHISFSTIIWLIIQKWGRSYQFNTGFILLFMVIFWIFHVVAIIELINITLPKNEQQWNQYIQSLKVDNQSKIKKIKKYLIKKWKIM